MGTWVGRLSTIISPLSSVPFSRTEKLGLESRETEEERKEGGERKKGEKTANSVHDDVEQTT